MNTEQMRAEFEEVFPNRYPSGCKYFPEVARYVPQSPSSAQYAREYTIKWEGWQACCKKQEDRIAELESKLAEKQAAYDRATNANAVSGMVKDRT